MDNADSISKLLRLKRYEQPSEEYFQNFLLEFQNRQRSEVIHRPLLQIAWDRCSSLFDLVSMPRLVMASSFAAAVIAAAFVWNPADNAPSTLTIASTGLASLPGPKAQLSSGKTGSAVQYVLPAKPVSYASARSF
ncbi:MAG: hypothetical protein WCG66_03970 [bacterium]